MARLEQIGRRTWFGRMAGGAAAIWTGLHADGGVDTWAGFLGGAPRRVEAAQAGTSRTLPIEVEFNLNGAVFPVAAYVVVRGREIAVVDTLVPGNAERIGAMIAQAGLDWRAVRHLILTHWHPDHAGSAADVVAQAPQASIWAGAPDIPLIDLPRPINPVFEGDEVFGLQVIATPGHTAGHISVLDTSASTLLAGDAAVNLGGQMGLPPAEFTDDLVQALGSVQKLGGLRFEGALFGHGVAIEHGASEEFARLGAAGAALADPSALVDHRHNCLLHV